MRVIARSKGRAGFTLVELLVVVGIIAVLIALLMPALSKVRKHAQEVSCAANLHSIGQALTMYTQQYDRFPGCWIFDGAGNYAVWPVRLRPFTSGAQGPFICPARDDRFEWRKVPFEPGRPGRATSYHANYGYEAGEPLLDIDRRAFSYGYNMWGAASEWLNRGLGGMVNPAPAYGPRLYPHEPGCSAVRSPSNMIAIADSMTSGTQSLVIAPYFDPTVPLINVGNVHRGGANVLFCDGHVEWYAQKDLVITYNVTVPAEEAIRRMWNNDHLP